MRLRWSAKIEGLVSFRCLSVFSFRSLLLYRVTHLVEENLPLTQFRQFRQLVGRYCSYLLPRQVDGTFKIQVNWRFSSMRCVTLYSYLRVVCRNGFTARPAGYKNMNTSNSTFSTDKIEGARQQPYICCEAKSINLGVVCHGALCTFVPALP